MAKNLKVDEKVFIPKSKIGIKNVEGSAFRESRVISVTGRTITIDSVNDAGRNVSVASSLAHRNIGFLIVRIGDFLTESTLLDPLAKSILQFARILVTDSFVSRIDIRTIEELKSYWAINHAVYSHIVFIGHGSADSVTFGAGDPATAQSFISALEIEGVQPKTILSLACETGKAPIAKAISASSVCNVFVAPYSAVHGADSSLFVQMFLNKHLLDGRTTMVAFKQAYEAITKCPFRIWEKGKLKAGYHSR
jgi:hypothetical protein